MVDLSRVWHLLLRSEVGRRTVSNIENLPGQLSLLRRRRSQRARLRLRRSVAGQADGAAAAPGHRRSPGQPVKPGGRDLLTGTVEIERDLPRNFGVAAFFDGGNAMDHFSDPLAYSVGLGFRLRLPVVTVGLDVAQALRAPGFDRLARAAAAPEYLAQALTGVDTPAGGHWRSFCATARRSVTQGSAERNQIWRVGVNSARCFNVPTRTL